MRVPLGWLRDYVDVELTPEQLAERLTLLGMEVKGIERWGAEWRSVVVGELLSVERHPRADRLSLTTVRVGGDEVLEIVCGATNIAPGQRVPVALPGAVLPGGRRIERAEKMGVTSNGMLCSGDELELTTDAQGILILPPDAPLGIQLSDLYGDVVLDVDVKPNRGDALCLVGLAREVSAATGAPVRWPDTTVAEAGRPTSERLAVSVEAADLCSRFVGRWISGVRVGPAPDLVQMRLRAAGMRPVSNVVDASNYVMLELGKPIHTFDAAAVRDGRIVVRTARSGERLETLDHTVRELDPETLVIADSGGVLAIAGVIGGAASEVGQGTTEIIVESAVFDPISIRRTGQRYGLRSEASLRFEKGQETRLARIGADRVAGLIGTWAGGSVAPGRIDTAPDEPADARVAFRPARLNRLLGTSLAADQQRELLGRVGVETSPATGLETVTIATEPRPLSIESVAADTLVATIPSWRHDLRIEADIAEEVARVRGYEHVPSILPDTPMPPWRPSPLELRDAVRDTLAGAGLTEVVTPALVSPRMVEMFGPRDDGPIASPAEGRAHGRVVVVANPLSSQHSMMRQSLLGSLLEVVATNRRHGREDVAIFEVGKGYAKAGPGDAPDDGRSGTHEWWRLGFALTGDAEPPAWNRTARPYDLDDAKGVIELLCRRLGFAAPGYEPVVDDPNLHPGRAAVARSLGGWTARASLPTAADAPVLLVGRVGELHPLQAEALELGAGRILVGELAISGLAGGQLIAPRGDAPNRHPAVERDIAVVVPTVTPAAVVRATILASAGPLLTSCRLFDVYRGAPLAPDEKSLAQRLVFQALDRTLTDAEIDARMSVIAAALASELGARLRA